MALRYGGGLVALHGASASFGKSDVWAHLIGARFAITRKTGKHVRDADRLEAEFGAPVPDPVRERSHGR